MKTTEMILDEMWKNLIKTAACDPKTAVRICLLSKHDFVKAICPILEKILQKEN